MQLRWEFKASVLGADERADRAITVDRLERLARFNNVPIDHLLPIPPSGPRRGPGRPPVPTKTAIDLARLDELHGPEYRMLDRYHA